MIFTKIEMGNCIDRTSYGSLHVHSVGKSDSEYLTSWILPPLIYRKWIYILQKFISCGCGFVKISLCNPDHHYHRRPVLFLECRDLWFKRHPHLLQTLPNKHVKNVDRTGIPRKSVLSCMLSDKCPCRKKITRLLRSHESECHEVD